MADDNEVSVKITADASGVREESHKAAEDISSFGTAARQAFREGVPELARFIQLFQELGEAIAGGKGFIEQLGAAIALTFATKEIVAWAGEVTEAAEKIEHLSAQLGASTGDVQEIGAVSLLTGTSFDGMVRQLERLQLRLAHTASASNPATQALKALGLSAEEFRKQPISQQLDTLAEAFSKFADGPQKTAAAMALLGRAGAEMIPFLDRGKDGLRELGDAAEQSGVIMSSQTVAAFAKTREDLNLLGLAVTGFSQRLYGLVNGAVDAGVRGFTSLIEAANPQKLAGPINALVASLISEAESVVAFCIKAAGAFGDLVNAIVSGGNTIASVINSINAGFQAAGVASHNWLSDMWDGLTKGNNGLDDLIKKRKQFDTLNPTGGASGNLGDLAKEYDTEAARQKARLDSVHDSAERAKAAVQEALGISGSRSADRATGDNNLGAAEKPKAGEIELGGAKGGKGKAPKADPVDLINDQEEIKQAEDVAKQKEKILDDGLAHHRISAQEWLNDSLDALKAEAAAVQQIYTKELETANLTEKQKTEIKKREADELRSITDKEAADEEKYLDTLERQYEKTGDQIMSAFDSQFNAILSHQETWGQAMGKITEKLGMDVLKWIEQMVVQWVSGQLAMTQASVAGAATRTAAEQASGAGAAASMIPNALHIISADAAQAFAGVFAFMAPLLGPAAAGPAAAASGTVLAAGGAIAAADVGMYNVPSDQLAMIHRNELVMPAPQAGRLREVLGDQAGGSAGGVAIHPTTNIHLNALDGASTASWMRQNGPGMVKAIDQAVRHGAALGARRLKG